MWVQHHSQHHKHHSSWKSNPSTFCLDASHPYVIKWNRNRLHASALPAQAPPTVPPGSAGALPLVLHASTVILVLVARSTVDSGGNACITVWLNVPDIVGGQWCGRCLVCLNIGVGGGEGIGRDNVGKSNTAN